MSKESLSVTPVQHNDYEWLRGELAARGKTADQYSDEFLAYYQEADKDGYDNLSVALSNEEVPLADLSYDLEVMDEMLGQFEYNQEKQVDVSNAPKTETDAYVNLMKANEVMNADQAKIEVKDKIVTVLIPCAGRDLMAVKQADGNWTLEGVQYDNDADGVFEDVWDIQMAMHKVENRILVSTSKTPFEMGPDGNLLFNGVNIHAPIQNTFESNNNKAMEDVLNDRYQELMRQRAGATVAVIENKASPAAVLNVKIAYTKEDFADLSAQYRFANPEKLEALEKKEAKFDSLLERYNTATLTGNFAETVSLENEIQRMVAEVSKEWDENYVESAPEEAVPAVVAPETAAPEAPDVPEVAKAINNETEFAESLKGEGWKKLATVSGNVDTGSMVIKGFAKDTPEYDYSRIHHFFGNNGAALTTVNLNEYEQLQVNGEDAEWKITRENPEGTLVKKGTEKRFLLKDADTTVTWSKKAPDDTTTDRTDYPTTVPPAAEVPPAPQAAAEELNEAQKTALVNAMVKDDGEWRVAYLNLQKRDAALRARQRKAEGFFSSLAPKKQRETLASIKADSVSLANAYREFDKQIAKYKSYVDDNVQALAFLESTTKQASDRVAELDANTTNSRVVETEAPAAPVKMAGTNSDASTVG